MNKVFFVSLFFLIAGGYIFSQNISYSPHYIGILPSVLLEPYDTVDAIEINIIPFVYEYRFSRKIALQARPIVNYRILESNYGISQTGGSLLLNYYFYSFLGNYFWLTPQNALLYTYAYNQLDTIHTMTLGIEPGCRMKVSDSISVSVNLQGGINYYPDSFSRAFVRAAHGLKPHFGIIAHIGLNIPEAQ